MGVSVLDPDDEITSALLGIEVVIESRADSAHMQRTGRRRRESYSRLTFHN